MVPPRERTQRTYTHALARARAHTHADDYTSTCTPALTQTQKVHPNALPLHSHTLTVTHALISTRTRTLYRVGAFADGAAAASPWARGCARVVRRAHHALPRRDCQLGARAALRAAASTRCKRALRRTARRRVGCARARGHKRGIGTSAAWEHARRGHMQGRARAQTGRADALTCKHERTRMSTGTGTGTPRQNVHALTHTLVRARRSLHAPEHARTRTH
eukprot:6189535-Pleurochrysis_carterae.AAC.2